jgi:hypothetical protein
VISARPISCPSAAHWRAADAMMRRQSGLAIGASEERTARIDEAKTSAQGKRPAGHFGRDAVGHPAARPFCDQGLKRKPDARRLHPALLLRAQQVAVDHVMAVILRTAQRLDRRQENLDRAVPGRVNADLVPPLVGDPDHPFERCLPCGGVAVPGQKGAETAVPVRVDDPGGLHRRNAVTENLDAVHGQPAGIGGRNGADNAGLERRKVARTVERRPNRRSAVTRAVAEPSAAISA